jgi:DNA-binding response OmpR family regulator
MQPTILLVEPNRLFGDGLALLLEWRMGSRCVRAGSLAEARTILEEAERKPVCAVVDFDLPEGQAAEVLGGLDGVPVLALIERRDVRRQVEAIRLGAKEVLLTREAAEKGAVAVQRLINR